MKLLFTAILLTLLSVTCHAQVTASGFQQTTFANLPTKADGAVRYVTDGTAGSPCTGGGSGAFAYRIGSTWVCSNASSGSGGAPTNATYITQTANGTLTNEQALSTLSNGLMRVATSTGVVTSINTSAGVAANLSDETGSGALVFGTSPTIATAILSNATLSGTVSLGGAVSIVSGSAGNLTIAPTGSVIFNPSASLVAPSSNYSLNLGSLPKKYLTLNAAELWVQTLVAQNTMATYGGRILIAPSNTLIADLTNVATTFDVKYNNLTSGDRVYMETNGNVEFMAVTSGSTPITGGYRYTVTRNLDGSGANSWSAGDSLVDTGTTGSGFIDAYSITGIPSATSTGNGPTIVGNVRNSATYNDWSPTWAIGNLDGLYGYSGTTYGVALGKYAASNSNILIDSTNGIRIRNGTSTVIGQWSTAGVITIGEVGASKDNIQISSGAISIRNNTTERIGMTSAGVMTIKDSAGNAVLTFDASAGAEITKKLTMPGVNSAIAIGATPPVSSSSGTGVWMDRNGLFILQSSLATNYVTFKTGAVQNGTLGGADSTMRLYTGSGDGVNPSQILLGAYSRSGATSINLNMVALNSSNTGYISIWTEQSSLPGGLSIGSSGAFQPATLLDIKLEDSATNAYSDTAIFRHNSSGTPAASFGSSILFTLESTTTADQNAGRIGALWTTATHASRTSALTFQTVNNAGSLAEAGRFTGAGQLAMGTTSPAASAIVDLTSTTGALLVPRLTSTQRDALTAVNGMIIYNSTTDKLQVRAAATWVDLH